MSDNVDDYPDLGYDREDNGNDDYGVDERDTLASSVFVKKMNASSNIVQNSQVTIFESSPSVVHFGGFIADKDHVQTISLINCSTNSQRFQVLIPTTEFFKVCYITMFIYINYSFFVDLTDSIR